MTTHFLEPEAQQMADEAQAADVPDADAWSGALNLRAMLLARRGQLPAARRMLRILFMSAPQKTKSTPAANTLTLSLYTAGP